MVEKTRVVYNPEGGCNQCENCEEPVPHCLCGKPLSKNEEILCNPKQKEHFCSICKGIFGKPKSPEEDAMQELQSCNN
jgi:hypothetical protein